MSLSGQGRRSISLDAAIVITEQSKRTLWRRVTDGLITRVGSDARGRALLAFDEVMPFICIDLEAEELSDIQKADTGDANAQNEIGQLFIMRGKPKAGLFWLMAAAEHDHADAMRHVGNLYIAGTGVPKDVHNGVSWIAKAASFGSLIAKTQINEILKHTLQQ